MLKDVYSSIPQRNIGNTMDYKKIVDTAVLAGQIMLESNAEAYRIEDVLNRILDLTKFETTEALAMATALIITLDDPSISSITVLKRITVRNTNLNKISRVNTICRNLTTGVCTLDFAYNELKNIDQVQYKPWIKDLTASLISAFFSLLFGGGIIEFLIAWINGCILVLSFKIEKKVNLGFFIQNVIYTAFIAMATTIIKRYLLPNLDADIVITSSIMPLVPGTAITNAFRDTLRGDYMSGGAKALEAVVIALAIAVGAALGLIITGGSTL